MLGSREAVGFNALGSCGYLPQTQCILLNQSQPMLGILLEAYPNDLRDTVTLDTADRWWEPLQDTRSSFVLLSFQADLL